MYYFIYTDIPKECIKNLETLILKLEENNQKPKSRILSANIKVADKEEYDILDILQKYDQNKDGQISLREF